MRCGTVERGSGAGIAALVGSFRFADGKIYLSRVAYADDLYLDCLTLANVLMDIVYKAVGNFGDMYQTAFAFGQGNKRPKLSDAGYFSLKNLSHCWLHKEAVSSCFYFSAMPAEKLCLVACVVKDFFAGLDQTEFAARDVLNCLLIRAVVNSVLQLRVGLHNVVYLGLESVALFLSLGDLKL